MGIIWMVLMLIAPKFGPITAAVGGIFSLLLIVVFTVLATEK